MNEKQFTAEAHEQKQKSQVLLEIGHSTRSLAEHATLAFTEGQVYVGLELPQQNTAYSQMEFAQDTIDAYRKAVKANRPDQNIHYLTGDASKIPLAANSVDKVFMANVTDSPLHAETPELYDELFLSVRRILKPEGEIVIFEDRTPVGSGLTYEAKVLQLRLLGFDIIDHIVTEDDRFEELRERYGMQYQSGFIVPLVDEKWKKLIEQKKRENPDWKFPVTKALSGDYFMILRKSKQPPAIISGKTPHSKDLALQSLIDEELRKKGHGEYVDRRKHYEANKKYREEIRQRNERRKQLAIATTKVVGRVTLRGIKSLHRALKQ